jgi:hypothetical protein
MKYAFQIVDVFSSTPFGGNQLAILPDAAGISTRARKRLLANSISAKRLSSCQRTIVQTTLECASARRKQCSKFVKRG